MALMLPPPPDTCLRRPDVCKGLEEAMRKHQFIKQLEKATDRKARIYLNNTILAPLVSPAFYIYNIYKDGAINIGGFGILIKDVYGIRFTAEFD